MDNARMEGLEGRLGGQAPVQGCGHVDGYPWYFRARGDGWSLEIVDDKSIDSECLPLVPFAACGWLVEGEWGEGFAASYMPVDTAWNLILEAVSAFRQGKLRYFFVGKPDA